MQFNVYHVALCCKYMEMCIAIYEVVMHVTNTIAKGYTIVGTLDLCNY